MASGSAAKRCEDCAPRVLRAFRARLCRIVDVLMRELQMIQRSLLLSAFVLLSSIIGGAPKTSAAADDPAILVGDLGTRALAAMRNGDTAAARQGRFRQLFLQYFDAEACARSALGPHWQNATVQQRQEYVKRYEDYIVIVYSTYVGHLSGANFTVLGSQPDEEGVIIVTSRIDGAAPIGVDWHLNSTNSGYKVTNLIVSGIDMASMQRSDLVSVIQRNGGHVQALLAALREKNASNGILR
jgi:phospholipid transport system substrate-binding protein